MLVKKVTVTKKVVPPNAKIGDHVEVITTSRYYLFGILVMIYTKIDK